MNQKRNERIGAALISPAGAAWLTQTLDPFHDHPKEPVGKPDKVAGQSIVYCINEQITLTATEPSDVHVFTLPEICQFHAGVVGIDRQFTTPTVSDGDWIGPYATANSNVEGEVQAYGLFNWSMVSSGLPTINCPDLDSSGNLPPITPLGGFQGCSNYSRYCNGRSRVVSAAFEIHNTSPEIYRGGSSTSYRMSQQNCKSAHNVVYSAVNQNLISFTEIDTIRVPPRTLAEATAIPDCVVLASEEGNYTVVPVHVDDPAELCVYRPLQLRTSETPNTKASGLMSTAVYPGAANLIYQHPPTDPTSSCRRPAAIDTVGSYHTGLVAGSTLTINFRVYLEVFPGTADPTWPLSHRSPAFCPYAEESLIRAFQHLPVSVPVKWNAAEKWWRIVLRALGAIAPYVGMIAGPEGEVVGLAVGAGLTALGSMPMAKPSKSPAEVTANKKAAEKEAQGVVQYFSGKGPRSGGGGGQRSGPVKRDSKKGARK